MHKIVILGSGYSLSGYKFQEGDAVWCPLSMKDQNMNKAKPLYFGMHEHEKEIAEINLKNYPIKEISEKYQSCFFTNTVSYMLAYALYTGIQEIEIFGVDMSSRDEYVSQRPSVLYWIGYLRANGVKVKISNDIDKPPFIYGYESSKSLKSKIKLMTDHANINLKGEISEAEKNQYIGFLHALTLIEKEL